MIKTLMKRVKEKKGFTLMEMLIVVAIIAILVAVAFPVFNAQLDKAREATDDANMRSAKAVALAEYLTTGTAITGEWFDITTGTIGAKPTVGYGQKSGIEDFAIAVEVTAAGVFTGTWTTLK